MNATPLKAYDRMCSYMEGLLVMTCSRACYGTIVIRHNLYELWDFDYFRHSVTDLLDAIPLRSNAIVFLSSSRADIQTFENTVEGIPLLI